MKTNVFLAGALSALTAVLYMPTASSAQFTMKITHSAAPGEPRDIGAHIVADAMNKSKTCSMDAKVYPSDQLGGSSDIYQLVQLGSVEATLGPTTSMVPYQPLLGVLDLPYLMPTDPAKLEMFYRSEAMDKLVATTESAGFVTLGVWHAGYKQWTGPHPMVEPKDFKGLSVRAMNSDIVYEQNRLLGMQNVSMNFADTYTALQTGTIQGQDNPIPLIYNMKFYEVQKYLTLTKHGILNMAFYVSKIWWNKLTKPCQEELRSAVRSASQPVYDATEGLAKTDLALMTKAGIKVADMTADQRKVLADVLEPATANFYVKRVGQKGQDLWDMVAQEVARLEAAK